MNGGFDGVRRMASRWKWLACVWLVAWFVLHAGAGVASVLPDELKEAISQAGIPREAVGIVVEPLDGGEPVVSLNAESAFHTASYWIDFGTKVLHLFRSCRLLSHYLREFGMLCFVRCPFLLRLVAALDL